MGRAVISPLHKRIRQPVYSVGVVSDQYVKSSLQERGVGSGGKLSPSVEDDGRFVFESIAPAWRKNFCFFSVVPGQKLFDREKANLSLLFGFFHVLIEDTASTLARRKRNRESSRLLPLIPNIKTILAVAKRGQIVRG